MSQTNQRVSFADGGSREASLGQSMMTAARRGHPVASPMNLTSRSGAGPSEDAAADEASFHACNRSVVFDTMCDDDDFFGEREDPDALVADMAIACLTAALKSIASNSFDRVRSAFAEGGLAVAQQVALAEFRSTHDAQLHQAPGRAAGSRLTPSEAGGLWAPLEAPERMERPRADVDFASAAEALFTMSDTFESFLLNGLPVDCEDDDDVGD